jgi:hypothetical protein
MMELFAFEFGRMAAPMFKNSTQSQSYDIGQEQKIGLYSQEWAKMLNERTA